MFFFMNGMHLKDATYDICYSFMDKQIDILFKLQVWNMTDATYDACYVWHMK